MHFDIPSERGDLALRDFARQVHRQILFPYPEAHAQTTPAVRGEMTAEQALSILIRATGLQVTTSDDRVIALAIAPPSAPAFPAARPEPAPAAALPIATAPSTDVLGELVVTANRTSDTVGHVPLSITALTQRMLDGAGAKDVQDLARTVPSLVFRRNNSEGNPNIAIRGVSSMLGSPTTGVYLDDTPLQKRDNPGAASGNGSPQPVLFDLERVEVLRGPQGTLYGASAEGGAVRFITPQPSLTQYSVYARASVSSTDGGSPSSEGGVALGGPIVRDKLGFRLSLFDRHSGGYIDETSLYDSHAIASDVNWGDTQVGRIAVTWQPLQDLKITPAFYYSNDHVNAQDLFWEKAPRFALNSGYLTNAGVINGVKYDFPDTYFPGGVYGPYNQFGPGKSGTAEYLDAAHDAEPVHSPRTSILSLPTLTVDYGWRGLKVKSITSFISDSTKGYTGGDLGVRSALLPTATSPGFVDARGQPVPGGVGVATILLPGKPLQYRTFDFDNVRSGIEQELRVSSDDPQARLNWVGGVFYSHTNQKQHTISPDSENADTEFLRGISEAWLLGEVNLPGNDSSERVIWVNENEISAFGELNYRLTDALTLTAGIRVSHDVIGYSQITGSSVQGSPPGFVGTAPGVVTDVACGADPLSCYSATFHPFPGPGEDPYTRFSGTQVETPVTPKFGLSYQANPRDLFYVTVAKGYRTGGLNQPVPVQNCIQDLLALGITATPLTYNSDSVWSYEGGAKLRVTDQTQINSSVFYIDWQHPQLQNKFRSCGQNYIVNAGHARSEGFDVQAQTRLFDHLTLNGSVAYTDAIYTQTYSFPAAGGPVVVVNKGDQLGAPRWQLNVGGQFDWRLLDRWDTFVRADYQYSSQFQRGVGPGAQGYDAQTVVGAPTHYLTARAGVTFKAWELAAFVDNLTNSQDRLYELQTANSPLVSSSTFRPRQVGVEAVFRY
jgi:outer membrane receptor protein involved in Fe transport